MTVIREHCTRTYSPIVFGGPLAITGVAPADGKVLTSDADGPATWQVAPTGYVLDTTAADIAALGAQAAGATGKAADAGHVHPTTGVVLTSSLPLDIGSGGTGQVTQAAALTALAGTQTAGYYLRSDGTNAALSAIAVGDLPTATEEALTSGGALFNRLMANTAATLVTGTLYLTYWTARKTESCSNVDTTVQGTAAAGLSYGAGGGITCGGDGGCRVPVLHGCQRVRAGADSCRDGGRAGDAA